MKLLEKSLLFVYQDVDVLPLPDFQKMQHSDGGNGNGMDPFLLISSVLNEHISVLTVPLLCFTVSNWPGLVHREENQAD